MTLLIFGFIVLAAALDVIANLLLKKSDGLKHLRYGIPALLSVCIAFTLLAQVTKTVDLTVAYVIWGAMAILGTVISARFMFGQKLNLVGWLGICAVISSIILIKTA